MWVKHGKTIIHHPPHHQIDAINHSQMGGKHGIVLPTLPPSSRVGAFRVVPGQGCSHALTIPATETQFAVPVSNCFQLFPALSLSLISVATATHEPSYRPTIFLWSCLFLETSAAPTHYLVPSYHHIIHIMISSYHQHDHDHEYEEPVKIISKYGGFLK